MIQELGTVHNLTQGASGPVPDHSPTFGDFIGCEGQTFIENGQTQTRTVCNVSP
jgi:hypothetical protein